MIARRYIQLSASSAPPTEFRLFTKGWNNTEKGRFLFDAEAANAVMSASKEWGIDLCIDLEHQLLDVAPGAPDPTARDARGWFQLELRPDGSLWAVNVKWTADGAKRLTEKRQRYISPAFECDPDTKRITKVVNAAITAIPATHKTPALVAASKRHMFTRAQLIALAISPGISPLLQPALIQLADSPGLDPSLVQKALDAVEKGDAKAALEILKGLIASAAGASPPEDGDDAGSEGDGAEGVPTPETESVESPEVVDASDTSTHPGGANDSDDGDDDGDDQPAKKAAAKALHAFLRRLTGKKTFGEAVAQVEIYRASHVTLASERNQLAKERAVLENDERRRLVVELVTLGAEFPSTVWLDSMEKRPTQIKPRWAKMPIAELRSHVSEQRAARKKSVARTGTQPAREQSSANAPSDSADGMRVTLSSGRIVTLSASEMKICKSAGADPKDFAALKARRDGLEG